MKIEILFLAILALLAACETTNYPTKVVEVPGATVVETKVVTTKIDCASIDSSFEQVGDNNCVSICVACIKGGGQCLDTDQNGYGDTCVTPVVCTPQEEFCNNVDDDCDGETDENQRFWYVDGDHDGFGDPNKPVVAGCVPPTTGPWLVISDEDCNDADAGISPTTADLCDYKDNNCDGFTDESFGLIGANCQMGIGECAVADSINVCTADGSATTCSKPAGTPKTEVCGDNKDNDCDGQTDEGCVTAPNPNDDNDNDGFTALDDCNDNDASVQPGFDNCPVIDQLTKYSYKLVLVWGNKADANWPYKNTLKYKQELSFVGGGYNTTDLTGSNWDSWQGAEFAKGTFVAIDLDPAVKFIRFNEFEYPGKWMICNAAKVNDTSVDFNTLNLPTIYVVKNGVWEDVTAKIGMQAAVDTMSNGPMPKSTSPSGYPQLNYCSATLTF